jgi:hypothetical protein
MSRPYKLDRQTRGWKHRHDYKKCNARWFRREEKKYWFIEQEDLILCFCSWMDEDCYCEMYTDSLYSERRYRLDNAPKKYRYYGWF